MKKIVLALLLVTTIAVVYADESYPVSGGTYIIPDSSIRNPADTGVTEHTFDVIFKPNVQSHPSHDCETPASLACVYGLTAPVEGCPIAGTTANPTGGAGTTIAIVDAYDNASQDHDLRVYSTEFGLPAPNLTIYKGDSCTVGAVSGQGWQDEHVLDLEMVHAMAPYARIYMVEAKSGGDNDMRDAEQCATSLMHGAGGGIVSNSWGGDEYRTETSNDTLFQNDGIV